MKKKNFWEECDDMVRELRDSAVTLERVAQQMKATAQIQQENTGAWIALNIRLKVAQKLFENANLHLEKARQILEGNPAASSGPDVSDDEVSREQAIAVRLVQIRGALEGVNEPLQELARSFREEPGTLPEMQYEMVEMIRGLNGHAHRLIQEFVKDYPEHAHGLSESLTQIDLTNRGLDTIMRKLKT